MGYWVEAHRFNSGLAIKISLLILGFMVGGALLVYQSYVFAR
jgi:hypothetical protein